MEVPLVDTRRALTEGESVLPTMGEVLAGDRPSLPFFVTDGAGDEVEAISTFLTHLALCDMSRLTCRSYAHDLLRWWRPADRARGGLGGRDHGRGGGAGRLAAAPATGSGGAGLDQRLAR